MRQVAARIFISRAIILASKDEEFIANLEALRSRTKGARSDSTNNNDFGKLLKGSTEKNSRIMFADSPIDEFDQKLLGQCGCCQELPSMKNDIQNIKAQTAAILQAIKAMT